MSEAPAKKAVKLKEVDKKGSEVYKRQWRTTPCIPVEKSMATADALDGDMITRLLLAPSGPPQPLVQDYRIVS